MNGLLVEVTETPRGSQVLTSVVGSTTLHVEDITDFPEDGGIVDILGGRYTYTSAVADDPVMDDGGDIVSSGTLTFTAPVTADESDPVLLVVGDQIATTVNAVVDIPAGEDSTTPDGGDVVYVPLTRTQRAVFTVGPYVPPLPITLADDLSVVLDTPDVPPTLDGSLLDPTTVPTPVPTEPPAVSPPLLVTGTTNGLVVRAQGDIDPSTLIEYHITATPPADTDGEALPFTPDASTLVGEPTRATVLAITSLPDGTPLAVDKTYYLRSVATNVVGPAAPSDMVSGKLDLSNVGDFVALSLGAGFVLAGKIQVGQITIDPDNGITIPTPIGTTQFPADGSDAIITGRLRTNDVIVEDNLVINGELNAVAGTLGLAAQVAAPTVAPSYTHWVPTATSDSAAFGGLGLARIPDGDPNAGWVVADTAQNRVVLVNDAGATLRTWVIPAAWALSGVTYHPTAGLFLVAYDAAFTNMHLLALNATSGVVTDKGVIDSASVSASPAFIGYAVDTGNLLVGWQRAADSSDTIRIYELNTSGVRVNWYLLNPSHKSTPHGIVRAPVSGTVIPYRDVVVFDSGMETYPPGSSPTDNHVADKVISAAPIYAMGVTYYNGKIHATQWMPSRGLGRVLRYNSPRDWTGTVLGFTWYDSDPSGTGTHETTLSPTVTLSQHLWTEVAVNVPPPADKGQPDDPDSARVYMNGHLQGVTSPSAPMPTITSVNTSGAAPPTSNSFDSATGNPGQIVSDAVDADGPLIQLVGDGESRIGAITTHPDGLTRIGAAGTPIGFHGGIQFGTVDLNFSAQSSQTATVLLSFGSAPIVITSVRHNFASAQFVSNLTAAPTASGFTVRVADATGTNRTGTVTVAWLAIGGS